MKMVWAALVMLIAASPMLARAASTLDEASRWQHTAAAVTIARDGWGIAHVHGHTDADAVFGMIYAQAEDDFPRIEANYLTALGRTAEVEGQGAIWADLRQRMFVDPADLQARYATSPAWLKALMTAWADGLNFYLASHPAVRPRLLTRFEPWMALSFTEGSIGGDIESIRLSQLAAFYGDKATPELPDNGDGERAADPEPTGSNGIAIAPSHTQAGHALLLINPHTSFFFRSELQMTSDTGLNAYGAATWGQFFVYQGFNEHSGWMHTSSNVDSVDEFAETVALTRAGMSYRYGGALRPMTRSSVMIAYRTSDGAAAQRAFTIFRTRHGPIVRRESGNWIAVALMTKPVQALEQSFLRTRAHDYAQFVHVAALQANSSNNTLFADDKGEIAYLHPQFVPRRDDRFDYTKPVDGSNPATDWHGLHPLAELPHVLDPANGWVMNTNDAPWAAAGPDSPRKADFPRYMDQFGENARGLHAVSVLNANPRFTPASLIAAAYDPALPTFDRLLPPLFVAYDALPATDPLKARLADRIALLRGWDRRWAGGSTATSLAVFWGELLRDAITFDGPAQALSVIDKMVNGTTARQKLQALAAASDRLQADFGDWRTPWGEINRFQRRTANIVQTFDDTAPSIAVPFTSAQWGSLASFGAHRYPGTRRYYGTSGNSFVAVVEFGPQVRAWAVSAGGESGDPRSQHFNDQAKRYATGALRPVQFLTPAAIDRSTGAHHPGAVARSSRWDRNRTQPHPCAFTRDWAAGRQ